MCYRLRQIAKDQELSLAAARLLAAEADKPGMAARRMGTEPSPVRWAPRKLALLLQLGGQAGAFDSVNARLLAAGLARLAPPRGRAVLTLCTLVVHGATVDGLQAAAAALGRATLHLRHFARLSACAPSRLGLRAAIAVLTSRRGTYAHGCRSSFPVHEGVLFISLRLPPGHLRHPYASVALRKHTCIPVAAALNQHILPSNVFPYR